jgi:hypothetical protein
MVYRAKVLNYLKWIFIFLFLAFLQTSLLLMVGLAIALPGQLLRPVIIIPSVIIILSLSAFLTHKYLNPFHTRKKNAKQFTMSKRQRKIMWLVIFSCFVLFLAISAIRTAIDKRNLLPVAQQHFSVIITDNVSDLTRERMLLEFERAYPRIRSKYLPSQFNYGIITVNVFSNCAELQKAKGVSENVCAFFRFEDSTLSINLTSFASQQTIQHELTHAIVGELLGEVPMKRTPLWFNEGLAEYESSDSQFKSWDRLSLWRQRADVMTYEQFLLYKPDEDRGKAWFFQKSSLELMRYVLKESGESSCQQILLLIREGYSFDKAVKKVTKTYDGGREIYDEWVQLFFND